MEQALRQRRQPAPRTVRRSPTPEKIAGTTSIQHSAFNRTSEAQPETALQEPVCVYLHRLRTLIRRGDLAELRVAEGRVRQIELRRVGQVDCFGAEGQLKPLGMLNKRDTDALMAN